ncbi:MAG: OmpA family protein [Verrucomicrobiae bacterium]|nr:OmpA family protein [Verrucomicrobiae bacterium]
MNPSSPPADADDLAPPDPASSGDEMESIRALLLGPEKQRLEDLQQRIENPELHAQDVGRVLPQAVALSSARDDRLATALTPAVEHALKESVKRDPSTLVNAIFPIIGPAIRKSIAEAFSKLLLSLNQTLEHSLSPKGLKWRLEAVRTGKSFAEVVLAHTLLYRVEQVFLIHRQSGLLLQHLVAPQIQAQDAGMVSAMLTAIQDFAQDSFRVSAGEALHTLQIGELNVWVETGPQAMLAAVIRGQAPYEFRAVLQGTLETIHEEQGAALEAFDGDAAGFELARRHLEPCLQAQFAEPAKKKPSPLLPVLGGVAVVLIAIAIGFVIRDQRRWSAFLERLQAEPGIVVTESGRRSGRYFVAGLRDPLAEDPVHLLPEFHLQPEKVALRWEPYQALSPELVLRRAVKLLQPPASVTLRAQDGVLSASGQASGAWIESTRARAILVPGIEAYDDRGLAEEGAVDALKAGLERAVVFFDNGVQLAPGQSAVPERLAAQILELHQVALRGGRRLRVTLVGHSDSTGTEEHNLRLSRQRAEQVARLLVEHRVPESALTITGVAAREPWTADSPGPDPDLARNRRVTFRVTLEPTTAP